MPRGKSFRVPTVVDGLDGVGARRTQPKDEWGGFVPLNLPDESMHEFEVWQGDQQGSIWLQLDDCLGAGLKLTLVYDGANQCYIATFTGRPDIAGERAFTCCLSARAGTFDQALALLVYKHVSILGCDWWDLVNAPKKKGWSWG